jgi:hypothetical protein
VFQSQQQNLFYFLITGLPMQHHSVISGHQGKQRTVSSSYFHSEAPLTPGACDESQFM